MPPGTCRASGADIIVYIVVAGGKRRVHYGILVPGARVLCQNRIKIKPIVFACARPLKPTTRQIFVSCSVCTPTRYFYHKHLYFVKIIKRYNIITNKLLLLCVWEIIIVSAFPRIIQRRWRRRYFPAFPFITPAILRRESFTRFPVRAPRLTHAILVPDYRQGLRSPRRHDNRRGNRLIAVSQSRDIYTPLNLWCPVTRILFCEFCTLIEARLLLRKQNNFELKPIIRTDIIISNLG